MDFYKCFESKESAGKILAQELKKFQLHNPFLVAIPRGGIQVAKDISKELKLPINVVISKKLPLPTNPEVAFGAMTEDQINIINENMMQAYGISPVTLEQIASKINEEIKHRIDIYGRFNEEKVAKSEVIIVDDGVATGSSLIASIKKIKSMNPLKIIVAIPVSTDTAYEKVAKIVDKIICPIIDKSDYFAVSAFYKEWTDLSEKEIIEILEKSRKDFT